MKNLSTEQIANLQQSLLMPADIQITGYLGGGARAHVFKAVLGRDSVIVKVYREEAAQKYRKKYGVDIAEFEYQRNQSLFVLAAIKKYIARPYRVYPASSEYSHSIIQEHVSGKPLKAFVNERGGLPDEILEAGYEIVKQAEANGIHDLDISHGNMMVVDQDGEQILKLYDFNLMPQHLHPPNPFLGLAIKLELRGKSHRDYRNLKKWERHGEDAAQRALEDTSDNKGGGDN
jgi:tRNA A-37 threonylcarbamoyl transferase component Bud32